MSSRNAFPIAWSLVLMSGLAAGCASTTEQAATATAAPNASETALKLPSLPSLGDVTALASGPEKAAGTATELYARIARGANTCWFGGTGPLKKEYIYHAEADAPSRGGKAEITIHSRDPAQPNPRGPKAYKINIDPKGETAEVNTENLKMSDRVAAAMTSDVDRWSKGDQGCASTSTATAAGWLPEAPPAAPVKQAKPTKPAKKVAQKTKAVAAQAKPKSPLATAKAPVPVTTAKPAPQQ